MAAATSFPDELRLLSPDAFDFVLANELKRALRSQSFLTLVVLAPHAAEPASEALREVARVVSGDVRETDLLSASSSGQLSLVLLDADLHSSVRVIERVMARLEHYQFTAPLSMGVGAACCPTHGADADALRRVADPQVSWPRHPARGASNAK